MKKILTIAIALFMLCPLMSAQIQIKQNAKMEKIATISASWYYLYYSDGEYLLSLKSTNQFDDSYWLHLGNKEEALQSLDALIDLCDSLGKDDSAEISNGANKTYFVHRHMGGLSFHQKEPGMAGFTSMTKAYLKKTHAKIKEHNAE